MKLYIYTLPNGAKAVECLDCHWLMVFGTSWGTIRLPEHLPPHVCRVNGSVEA